MIKDTSILAANKRLAERIRREGKRPNSKYANKFVGIANGKVVVIADTLDDAMSELRRIEPDPSKCYGVNVAADYDRVYEV